MIAKYWVFRLLAGKRTPIVTGVCYCLNCGVTLHVDRSSSAEIRFVVVCVIAAPPFFFVFTMEMQAQMDAR